MIETTGELKLKKIELTDVPDITVINPNWDKLDEEVTRNKTNIGDVAQLTTQNNTSLVNAINEIDDEKIAKTQIKNNLTETIEGNVLDATMGKALKDDIDNRSLKTEVGTLSGLATTVKTSIVNAINEISGYIGKLQSLATNTKTSLVGAINENTNEINVLLQRNHLPAKDNRGVVTKPSDYKSQFTFAGLKSEGVTGLPTWSHVFGVNAYSGIDGFTNVYEYAFCNGEMYIRNQYPLNEDTWGEWKQLATTSKTDILVTPQPGYEVLYQKSYRINGITYLSVRVRKTDRSEFGIHQHSLFTIPHNVNRSALASTPYGDSNLEILANGVVNTIAWNNSIAYAWVGASGVYGIEVTGRLI